MIADDEHYVDYLVQLCAANGNRFNPRRLRPRGASAFQPMPGVGPVTLLIMHF